MRLKMIQFWQIFMFVAMAHVSGSGDFRSNKSPAGPAISSFNIDERLSQSFLQFEAFRNKFDRKYASAAETLYRFRVFERNLEKIKELNAMEKGTARFGVNDMADWTEEEFLAKRANLDPMRLSERLDGIEDQIYINDNSKKVPKSKDWREEGKVSPVKDQGQCGSCWAFATVACVESMEAIRKKSTARNYSVQQLVDCDPKSEGCDGGMMDYAIDYLIGAGGIEAEEDYPYTGKDGNCNFSNNRIVAPVTKKISLPPRNETFMKKFVGLVGPTTVGVNAKALQFYEKGVFDFRWCPSSSRSLNHAMFVVGYGTEKRKPYWIVKNSWGTSWGENGYLRIRRGRNMCGIALDVVSLSTTP